MPNLLQSFHSREIGFLRVVARLWGIELVESDAEKVKKELAEALLNHALIKDMVDSLPADARSCLEALGNSKGKLPTAIFSRRFGEIRETGPGRRDREQIFLNPISPAEVLYFRGLVATAFFDTSGGAQEFVYIPIEFLNYLKTREFTPTSYDITKEESGEKESDKNSKSFSAGLPSTFGRPATFKERAHPLASSDRLIDDATTVLAAIRMGLPFPVTRIPLKVVLAFLSAADIIQLSAKKDEPVNCIPIIDAVRRFLESSRNAACKILHAAWIESATFNELSQVPWLVFEGEWTNHPLSARKYIRDLIGNIPGNKWWSLSAFIQSIKETNPDFQRPAGDYDSWFIKRASDNNYLRGFASWDEVDGALVRYIITGPMFWLGLVDLATTAESDVISAFRTRTNKPAMQVPETKKLHVSSQGKIVVPRLSSRQARYQIARFCEWEEEKEDEYHYRVSISSLKKAAEQGLKIKQLLSVLARNAASEISPAFVKSLKRWDHNGVEARVETQTILRVSRPEVLEELRGSKAGRFLGETLGPVSIVIKQGAQGKVLSALAEMGLLAEVVVND